MNGIDDPRQNPVRIEHPSWCHRALCEATWIPDPNGGGPGFEAGSHVSQVYSRMHANDGHEVLVDVVQGAADRQPMVLVRVPSDEDELPEDLPVAERRKETLRRGEWIRLEPEEARMLARYLNVAAEEWERCHGA
jgi:hypothetical protein